MSFVYSTFLWALASLAIPIIIHLFSFRRTQRVYFSNIRLLKIVKETTSRKRKLKHLLVLFSRLLFLFFLVMAFAQPFLPAAEQLTSGKNIVLYVDNSYSMATPMPDKSRALDHAGAYVKSIIDLFPRETRYKLLTNDFAPFSNSYKTGTEIIDLVSQLRLSPVSRTVGDIERKALDGFHPDIFFLSDFQRSTFGNFFPADSAIQWKLLPIQPASTVNVYIDSAMFENPYLINEEKNRLTVWIRNDSKQNIDHLAVKLTINQTLAATTTLQIPPMGSVSTSFDVATAGEKSLILKVSIQDFPVTFDNEFYLTYRPIQKINITHIHPTEEDKYVNSVFGNSRLFSLGSFSLSNIDYSKMEKADLVVLNGLKQIDQAILRFASTHPEIVFFIIPSSKPDLASYSGITGLPLNVPGNEVKESLEAPDFRNPFFENVFEEKTVAIQMPVATRVLDWGADRSAFLKFRDGSPFLSKFRNGFILSCPLTENNTDFGHHALFVPVMYRMAASAKKDLHRPYYYLNENFISISADTIESEEPVRLMGDQEIVPAQRFVNGKIFLDLPKLTLTPGFFSVVKGKDTLGLLAFNLNKKESQMELYKLEELRKMAGSLKRVSIFESSDQQAFSNEIKERYLGVPLWKYCVALALVFLLTEILLIRYFKPST